MFFKRVLGKVLLYFNLVSCYVRGLIGFLNKSYNNKFVYLSYFDGVENVGDLLNVDIVEHYSRKKIVNVPPFFRFKHYLVIGSILQNMNKNSVAIGCGLIHDSKVNEIREFGDIRVVRGYLTKECLEGLTKKTLNIPLGDPALLFPRIFKPEISLAYEFGLVLHYVDESHFIKEFVESLGGRVISVRQKPRSFIEQIHSCKKILSSSMHGLILSDAYNIPNKRIILSDKIYGGDFKFKDYYSTTNNPNEVGYKVEEDISISEFMELLKKCSVKNYTGNLDLIETELLRLYNKNF